MRPGVAFEAWCQGVHFHGTAPDDAPGIYVTTVDGLLDGGDTTHDSITSGSGDGDGEFDTPNLRTDPRIITFTGYIQEWSMFTLEQQMMRLRGLLAARGSSGVLTWNEFGSSYETGVRRGAGCRVVRRGDTLYADFTVRFRAPSQRILGAELAVPAGVSIQVRNEGNYPACPVLTVTGNMPSGYTLTGAGKAYVVTQSLAPGQVHMVDMYDGILFRDGVAQPGGASYPRPILIPPNTVTTVTLTPVLGSGMVAATVRDTYI